MLLRRFLNPSVMITTDNYHERNLSQEKSLEISPIMTLTWKKHESHSWLWPPFTQLPVSLHTASLTLTLNHCNWLVLLLQYPLITFPFSMSITQLRCHKRYEELPQQQATTQPYSLTAADFHNPAQATSTILPPRIHLITLTGNSNPEQYVYSVSNTIS